MSKWLEINFTMTILYDLLKHIIQQQQAYSSRYIGCFWIGFYLKKYSLSDSFSSLKSRLYSPNSCLLVKISLTHHLLFLLTGFLRSSWRRRLLLRSMSNIKIFFLLSSESIISSSLSLLSSFYLAMWTYYFIRYQITKKRIRNHAHCA